MPPPPEYRIRRLIARVARIEDAVTRAQLSILRQTRRDILAAMVDAGAFDKFRLDVLLAAIDREIFTATIEAQAGIEGATREAFEAGRELASLALRMDLVGTSPELLQAVVTVTREQVHSVWAELGATLRNVVRRAALGITDPFKAMTSLALAIRNPKTFGRAFWRAETIVRTEVNRTFGLASQSELQRGAKAGVKLRKWWLTAGDERVRETHRQAGLDYPQGAAIPWDAFFDVGDDNLLHPLDPNGSPEETINCRCVSVPVVLD